MKSSTDLSPADEGRGKPSVSVFIALGLLAAINPLSIDMYLPAFPEIARNFQVSPESIQQTLAAFFLGSAIGQYMYGPLSDRFGRKIPLLVGMSIYAVAALGCALAKDVHSLVLFRLIQGFGGCAGVVISMAIVRDYLGVTEGARFMSQLMLIGGMAPILAPLLGGQILLYAGWRVIFFTKMAFGILCISLVATKIKETWGSHPHLGNIRSIARTQWGIMTDKTFLLPVLSIAFSQSAMFVYIMNSPNVFIKHFGVPALYFGFFFGANAIGLVGATQINRRLLLKFKPHQILDFSTFVAATVGILLIVVAWSGFGGVWGIAASLFLLLFSLGFIGANGAACAMAKQGKRAGNASALMGVMQALVASLTGSMAAWAGMFLGSGNPQRPMAAVISILTLTGCAVHWLGTKSTFDPPKRSQSNWTPIA